VGVPDSAGTATAELELTTTSEVVGVGTSDEATTGASVVAAGALAENVGSSDWVEAEETASTELEAISVAAPEVAGRLTKVAEAVVVASVLDSSAVGSEADAMADGTAEGMSEGMTGAAEEAEGRPHLPLPFLWPQGLPLALAEAEAGPDATSEVAEADEMILPSTAPESWRLTYWSLNSRRACRAASESCWPT